uniref:WD repeat-containing protein 76 n=1 Tax=Oryzias sinensis TaxID=183150 RepID=A0A8C7Z378_9TELE
LEFVPSLDAFYSRVKSYGQLSAYELERLENIRQNQAFLSSINLFQVGSTCCHTKTHFYTLQTNHVTVKPSQIKILFLTCFPSSKSSPAKKPSGPLPMEAINMAEDYKLPPPLLELLSEVLLIYFYFAIKPFGCRYTSELKDMKITEEKVVKVVKDRIFSAAFHPCSSSLLMAAGDKWGKVGLWNLGGVWGDDGVLLFEPHTRPVGCMAFSTARPTQLLSLSYDGSLRCMDVEKAVFDDVYDIEDGLKTFAFMSHDCNTLVVGDWYGEVAIVDRRTPGNSHESLHTLDTKTLRCVSVHPLQMQYFAVAESRAVNIYDSRCLKKTKSKAVSLLQGHTLGVSSAYFSPCSGNRVLTSYVIVLLWSRAASFLCRSHRHDMQTGRWLSKLSAVWDPKQEDCFVVGSMMRPRRVQVFHESGRLLHSFMDSENLNTVLSVTAFHPTRNAVLGGNASGRLHVFAS